MAEAKEPYFSSLRSPAPHPAACIAKSKKIFDAGNLALKSDPNTGPKLAIRAYQEAIKNFLIDYESNICELPARCLFDSYNVSVIVGHRLYALPGELRTDSQEIPGLTHDVRLSNLIRLEFGLHLGQANHRSRQNREP